MLASGQELSARFVLVRRLGRGGGGEVWLAQDRERGCCVAVKVLAERFMQDVAVLAALQRECEHVRALEHPNVLRVEALYQSAQHAWLAMEYAAGGDLTQLRGRGCLEILRATLPVAAALAHAHRAGIVHRDVKPANVVLTADGTPRLTDFGVALALDTVAPLHAGRGSPYSMSPQQTAGAAASIADDLYGFGAMLHELLSGYPPAYAEDPKDAAARRSAALPEAVPARLARLIERLLAASPADRPADMQEVERELTAVLAELPAPNIFDAVNRSPPFRIEPPSIRPPATHGEPLRGEWRRAAPSYTNAQELRRRVLRRGLAAAALALGIIGVVIVFFVLPQWVAEEQPARYVPAAVAVVPATPPEKKEIDFAALARTKQQAEEMRAVVDERLQKLAARAAQEWGRAEFEQAGAELAAGDQAYEAREYAAAVVHFSNVEPLAATLEKRASEVLSAQLQRGAAALEAGQSAQAKVAFELAAKIEPSNQTAVRGLRRATTLDAVLEHLATAQRLEKEGNPTAAIEHYRKALALDQQAPRAAAGVARIEAQLAADAFASAMARGYSALAKLDYAGARAGFEAARKIRPNAPEIAQALRQIEQEQRTTVIAAKLRTAQEHEAGERWADALQEYRAVIELDSTVAAAQEGVARVSPRAVLNEQLELYLTQPERLFSQPVRASARETLVRAAAIAHPGALLQRQTATLRDWLARADVPVQVALQSDNVTQVTIYRVGALGSFAQRSLELAPGSYTVVGTRPGYRDVRRQIDVHPGATLEPIVIRCEDRI